MDPFMLATQVIAILSPFIAKASEAVATKAGDALFEQGKRLYEAIHARFAQEAPVDGGKASQALDNFVKDPDNASVVETKLLRLLQTDSNFASTLSQIIKTGASQEINFGDDAKAKDFQMRNATGEGSQQFHTGDRPNLEGIIVEITSGEK